MLDSHEAHDVTKQTHRDGDDMTYEPVTNSVSDNRTSTQRINELTEAHTALAKRVRQIEQQTVVMTLTVALTELIRRVRQIEQKIERMTGD